MPPQKVGGFGSESLDGHAQTISGRLNVQPQLPQSFGREVKLSRPSRLHEGMGGNLAGQIADGRWRLGDRRTASLREH
jgi:hypothetical protein